MLLALGGLGLGFLALKSAKKEPATRPAKDDAEAIYAAALSPSVTDPRILYELAARLETQFKRPDLAFQIRARINALNAQALGYKVQS